MHPDAYSAGSDHTGIHSSGFRTLLQDVYKRQIDNTFLAVPMNKGILGAILVAAFFLLLLWRLAKKYRYTETICLLALTLYLFMENKPFLLSANPFLLLAPIVFFGGAAAEKKPDKT